MAIFKADKLKKTEIPPLLFPPLVEAVFELRWELQVVDQQIGRLRDPSYPMMYGRIYDRLQKDYPFIEDLPTTQVHPEANPFVVRHRIRKEQNGYPLMQIGPGVATINDSKNYTWSSFRAAILRMIEAIIELYPTTTSPLNFIKCEMRYVNGIRFDLTKDHPLHFLKDKLHIGVDPTPELFASGAFEDRPHSVNLNLAYPLKKPLGHIALSTNLGQLDGKNAYLFQTVIQSNGEMVPSEQDSFEVWLKEAHEAAENCFHVLCKGSLMDKFCGSNDER